MNIRADIASLHLKMQAITAETDTLLTKLEVAAATKPGELDQLIERLLLAAEREDSTLYDEARETIESMRKDAARYEFFREHCGQLVFHTAGDGIAVLVSVNKNLHAVDAASVDRAIDSAIAREEEDERSAALGDQQDDLSGPAAQRRGI